MQDTILDPVQVLQEPDAGAAMDGRDEQLNFTDAAIGKFKQALPDLFMIEIGIFLTYFSLFYFYSRMCSNIVILAGIALPEYFINGFTTMATKRLIIKNHRVSPAIFPAVITDYFVAFFQLIAIFLFRIADD